MAQEFEDIEEKRNVSTLAEYLSGYKESITTFRWIWNTLVNDKAKYWAKIFACIIIFQTIFEMLVSLPVRFLIDGLILCQDAVIMWSLIAYALCHIVPRLTNWVALFVRNHIGSENLSSLDHAMNQLFFSKSLGQHMHESSMLSSANMDKGRMRVIQIQEVTYNEAVSTISGLSIAFALLWWTSVFAGVVVSCLFLSVILWALYLNRQVMIYCLPLDKAYRAYNRYRVERWEHVERVKVNGKEDEEVETMHKRFSELLESERSFWKWYDSVKTIRGLINSFGIIAIVVYAAYQVSAGTWSVGLLFPLIAWGGFVKDNLWRIGELEHQLNWNLPSIFALKTLEVPMDVISGKTVIDSNTGISVELRDVSHAYPLRALSEESQGKGSGERMVLDGVSFVVPVGKKVALIGESGAGKTTIMRLLYRACDPSAGAIYINGVNLRDIDLQGWTQSIGYIAQSPQVFDGTIRYNLTYGLSPEEKSRVSDDELWSLMRRLKIDFGERLTNGLDTMVGRNGIKLSGGQAQRLVIGAAAIKKPKFMIIDEATSSLDSTTEKEVQRGLQEVLGPDVSALVITHRLSTVRSLCDTFVVLRSTDGLTNGESQVEAVGASFEELYQNSPTFKRLADDQDIIL